jgi:hypothetical protein
MVRDVRALRRRAVMATVPYVPMMLKDETVAALRGERVAYVDVSEDRHAYWRLLRGLWASGEDVLLVEQDIVPHRGALADLDACPWDWCAFPYDYAGMALTAFGFVRWRSEFTARYPDVVDGILERNRDWLGLDGVVIGELHRRGEKEHIHGPEVRHLHYPEAPQRRRTLTATRLVYVGDGYKYLHAIPMANFETDDPATIAVCLESGLYINASAAAKPAAPVVAEPEEVASVEPAAEPTPEPAATGDDQPPADASA